MEQAHTQLISQLNERILAADNTPLYIKFAETVKNAVRSGVLEHGNILPGERDLSRRFAHYGAQGDAGAGRRGRGDAFAWLRYADQQHLRILVERSARFFSAGGIAREKARYTMG